MGNVDCLVVADRVLALSGPGPWILGSSARGKVDLALADAPHARRIRAVRRGFGVDLEDLDGETMTLRGERRARHLVAAGDAVAAGRWQILAGELLGPDTVRWRDMLATAPESRLQLAEIARAAGSRAPVFIGGESGTGKELAAHAIHAASERHAQPFVALNCAALPETLAEAELFGAERGAYTGATRSRTGAFVQAHGGTLFLDEVGELPQLVQAKLLRALETGEVRPVGGGRSVRSDVRVVAASWRDLEALAEAGGFRADLLHRLCVLRVDLLPLRERREDILPLVHELLGQHDAHALAPDPVLALALVAAPWRGNIRELRNGVLRAVTACDPAELLPRDRMQRAEDIGGRGAEARTRAVVASTLRHYRGNRKRSASALGISRSTLYRWMAALDGQPPAECEMNRSA